MAQYNAYDLIRIIGSPFATDQKVTPTDDELLDMFEAAFVNRVAPLYLRMYRREGWDPKLEDHYNAVFDREEMTHRVIVDLNNSLAEWNPEGFAIFKSIKPYPAIPNDTDVIIFGGKADHKAAIQHLYDCGYKFHEWAPLQTTLYDPRGIGKIGKGKKGGTYYIDVYREISTDYFRYMDKRKLLSQVIVRKVNGHPVRMANRESELAIILFHNLFPERTYQLEHFYMPLYELSDEAFDLELFVRFVENNHLQTGVVANITLLAYIHEDIFRFVPEPVEHLLERWGRIGREVVQFCRGDNKLPMMFTRSTFWLSFLRKLRDPVCFTSFLEQGLRMLNPIFFLDVLRSLKNRLTGEGTYHME